MYCTISYCIRAKTAPKTAHIVPYFAWRKSRFNIRSEPKIAYTTVCKQADAKMIHLVFLLLFCSGEVFFSILVSQFPGWPSLTSFRWGLLTYDVSNQNYLMGGGGNHPLSWNYRFAERALRIPRGAEDRTLECFTDTPQCLLLPAARAARLLQLRWRIYAAAHVHQLRCALHRRFLVTSE